MPTTTTVPFTEPTQQQLQAALLTAADVGPPYVAQAPSDNGSGTTVSGCPGLAKEFNAQAPSPGTISQVVEFQGGADSLHYVVEGLVAEPEPQFDQDNAQSVSDLKSCQSLNFSSQGTTLSFSLTPIKFAPGSTGARLDGTYQGVMLNGYLAVQRVHNATLVFFYFQAGMSSSQEASNIYTKALTKATGALG